MNTLAAENLEYGTCPHCHGEQQPAPAVSLPTNFPLSFYDSNQEAIKATILQRIFRWKTLQTLAITSGFESASLWTAFKVWPWISGGKSVVESAGSSTQIGSFAGAQSINDLAPIIYIAALLLLMLGAAAIIPLKLGLWWWKREPARLPWDAPIAAIGELFDRGAIFERGPIFGEAG